MSNHSESQQATQANASLRLVKTELELLLQQAERQLSEFANYIENPNHAAWEQAATNLAQAAGVLEVIGLPGALELARALASTVELLEDADEGKAALVLPAIVRGLHLLTRYLASENNHPELLLPAINALRSLLNQKALPEHRFFNKAPRLPQLERGFVTDPNLARLPWATRRLRHMYQLGLLAVLREANVPQGLFLLHRALHQIEDLCGESAFADFCRLAQAGVQGLDKGGLRLNRERQLLLGQIDRQIKRLLQEPVELSVLTPPDDLVHALLHWVALSEPATPLLSAVRSAMKMSKHPSEAHLTLERAVLEDAGRGVLPIARRELKNELARIVAELDSLANAPEKFAEAAALLQGQLYGYAQTLDMLDMAEDGTRLRQAAERVRLEASQIGREQIVSLASELMDVEAHLATLLTGTSSAVAAPVTPLTEASREARQLLAEVQEALTAYIAHDWERSHLAGTAEKLTKVCTSLQFLRAERAAVVLNTCAQFIDSQLLNHAVPPSESEALEILADAIICIDYYLDGLAGNQGLKQGVIELAEESAEALLKLSKVA